MVLSVAVLVLAQAGSERVFVGLNFVPVDGGVEVTAARGPAAEAGLKEGDVLGLHESPCAFGRQPKTIALANGKSVTVRPVECSQATFDVELVVDGVTRVVPRTATFGSLGLSRAGCSLHASGFCGRQEAPIDPVPAEGDFRLRCSDRFGLVCPTKASDTEVVRLEVGASEFFVVLKPTELPPAEYRCGQEKRDELGRSFKCQGRAK